MRDLFDDFLAELRKRRVDPAERGQTLGIGQARLGRFGRRGARFTAHDESFGQLEAFRVTVQALIAADHLERNFDDGIGQAGPLGGGERLGMDTQRARELTLTGVDRGNVVLDT